MWLTYLVSLCDIGLALELRKLRFGDYNYTHDFSILVIK
jgi:hypothetical protein